MRLASAGRFLFGHSEAPNTTLSLARAAPRSWPNLMRWSLFDLRIGPPSFDFLTFLMLAKIHGAEGVWVVPGTNEAKLGQYDRHEQQKRVESIVEPACGLYGMAYRLEPIKGRPRDHDLAWPPYVGSGKALHNGYMVGWLKSVKEPIPFMPSQEALNKAADRLKGKEIVCHLRKTRYQDKRNSGPDWERWAADHNAYVLKDEPIDLDERCAIHELAKLNIGVNAGPMVLSEYSKHRPYVILKKLAGEISTCEDFYSWQGWYPGDQYPWAGKHQMLVWNQSDSYEDIEGAFQTWKANQEQAKPVVAT
jgi:hypothetical protein